MKRIFYSLLIVGALTFLPSKAYADCQSLYGGGQTCSNTFSIQKWVTNGDSFLQNQVVSFQVTIQNTGSQTISSINVVDTFPQFLSFISGPGSWDSNNNTLSFVVNNLTPGQSQSFTVSGRIANSNSLPGTCLVNQVTATDNNGFTNNSSAQFCITQVTPTPTPVILPVVKVTKTPPTGPEMLPLALLLPGALGGLYLRKKSKYNIEGGEK